MHPTRILIIGNYGAGNRGDDAILAGIKLLAKQGKIPGIPANEKLEFRVMAGPHHKDTNIYKAKEITPFIPTGLRSFFSLKKTKAAKDTITWADIAILGGGGLFVDTEGLKAPWIWFRQARTCKKQKTPYLCYGQSIGPLKYSLSRLFTRWTFKNAKSVTVRDKASLNWLKKEEIEAQLAPDAAFAYLKALKKITSKAEEKTKSNTKTLLLNLRQWKNHEEKWPAIFKAAHAFAKENNHKLQILAMDSDNYEECEALKKLSQEIKKSESLLKDEALLIPKTAKEAFDHIQKADLLISMRLHGLIFALAANTPCLSLAYSQKVQSLAESEKKDKQNIEILSPKDWAEKKILGALTTLNKRSRVH